MWCELGEHSQNYLIALSLFYLITTLADNPELLSQETYQILHFGKERVLLASLIFLRMEDLKHLIHWQFSSIHQILYKYLEIKHFECKLRWLRTVR